MIAGSGASSSVTAAAPSGRGWAMPSAVLYVDAKFLFHKLIKFFLGKTLVARAFFEPLGGATPHGSK